MSIKSLKELRTLAAMGGIIASATFLTGCGVETASFGQNEEVSSHKDKEDVDETIPSEYLNDKGNFDKHEHLIVEIGGITYIIRGCQPELKELSTSGTHSLCYDVYDKEGLKLIDGHTDDYHCFTIDTYLEELAIQEVENDLLENGAKLYKGLSN